MIFIHLSQSWHGKPSTVTNTWERGAAFRFKRLVGGPVLLGPERSCALASEAVEAAGHPTEGEGSPNKSPARGTRLGGS